jgi:hypothetical protein
MSKQRQLTGTRTPQKYEGVTFDECTEPTDVGVGSTKMTMTNSERGCLGWNHSRPPLEQRQAQDAEGPQPAYREQQSGSGSTQYATNVSALITRLAPTRYGGGTLRFTASSTELNEFGDSGHDG